MSIGKLISAGVIAVVIGCGAAAPQVLSSSSSPSSQPAATVTLLQEADADSPTECDCPDHTSGCCPTNGTGVYTAEGGNAGIGNLRLMITHFINNNDSTVTFQGRYLNPTSKHWEMLPSPGLVYRADYQHDQNLIVTSVSEGSTVPRWTLFDPTTKIPSAATITVPGKGLGDLKLYIQFTVPSSTERGLYTLEFERPQIDSVGKLPVSEYNMRWRDLSAPNAQLTQYCVTSRGDADPVVFQQAIDVDPVTGSVKRNSDTAGFVTMSCRLGALATVYSWGYDYRGWSSDPFYFDAGIQMKRASYCGDSQYYTVAGTEIQIADGQALQIGDISYLEALWEPTGARCLEPEHERHPELVKQKRFTGVCKGRPWPLPKCSQLSPPVSPYLADGPVTLLPQS